MKKIRVTFLMIFLGIVLFSMAQETTPKNCKISLGADFASMYLWRGFEWGNSPAIQPWAEFSYKNLTVGTWGSYGFMGDYKEVDLYAKYTYKTFTVMFIDLFNPGNDSLDQDFFNFNNKTTDHVSELSFSFNGSEKIPFSVFGGVLLYGIPMDHKPYDTTMMNDTTMNYSSYFEVNYLGQLEDISYNVFAGFCPIKSKFYDTDGFSFINIGVSAKKEIKVTDSFSIPAKLTVATNPESKKFYVAMLLSF